MVPDRFEERQASSIQAISQVGCCHFQGGGMTSNDSAYSIRTSNSAFEQFKRALMI